MHRQGRRPASEGFLALLPDEAQLSPRQLMKRFETELTRAREFAEYSRAHAMFAVESDDQGLGERARIDRRNAQVDHRMACERLAAAARTARRLLRCAALDWRPSIDVADSGLTMPELACLVAVIGPEEEHPEVSVGG